jgi:hypothetical protein
LFENTGRGNLHFRHDNFKQRRFLGESAGKGEKGRDFTKALQTS